ncbi:glycoside hydrolase family 47 [Lecanosticta acicola]|uniref:alpha-1,2-Mannosidase n=1 Tax=Lecanosticta acicola TaxID=111012 RepID=A0AAI9EB23_9PEZI|nr:glycoside hydrolase family 47 [Lecanosticta acicola]
MLPPLRRYVLFTFLAISFFVIALNTFTEPLGPYRNHWHRPRTRPRPVDRIIHPAFFQKRFRWRNVQQKHPVDSFTAPPTGRSVSIPKIQHAFGSEDSKHAVERKRRLRAVEEVFKHSWEGYKKNAWLQDEVSPLTGMSRNPFAGWAATLVDSLDTLWIMGLKKDFDAAVKALKKIDFTSTRQSELNVFETTIRYMGGLLSAYDLSGHRYRTLLEKATELGDMLHHAFDTPNRMPITRWDWQDAALGVEQEAKRQSLVAEVGSLTLEFTRLSQLTGDPKYYDAVARVMNLFEEQQNQTKLPGLWPTFIDPQKGDFTKDTGFTMGGMADSLYEYLPKQHILLGGQNPQYENMFLTALPAAKKHLFFHPMNPSNEKMLISGTVKRYSATNVQLNPQAEHLSCFAGGMVALAAKVFRQTHDLETARDLVKGCIWQYNSMPSGIGAEISSLMPCDAESWEDCTWNETEWQRAVVEKQNRGFVPDRYVDEAQALIKVKKLAPGFTKIDDARYILRPETIESMFVLYRITGDDKYQDDAWAMFKSIKVATKTTIAHAALKDVTQLETERELLDNMESFWTAETLKYFYLIFSDPDVVSLDDYVLNTEAHPLLRPK